MRRTITLALLVVLPACARSGPAPAPPGDPARGVLVTVLDPDGTPVPELVLRVDQQDLRTDHRGQVRVPHRAPEFPGDQRWIEGPPGLRGQRSFGFVDDASGPLELELRLWPVLRREVSIVDAAGAPVSGTEFRIGWESRATGEDGRFQVEAVAGLDLLEVRPPGRTWRTVPLDDASAQVRVVIPRPVTLRARATWPDDEDEPPRVLGAWVALERLDRPSVPGDDSPCELQVPRDLVADPGGFVTRQLEPGRWRVYFAVPGRGGVVREVELPECDAAEIALPCRRRLLRGRVVASLRRPLPRVWVALEGAPTAWCRWQGVHTDGEGRFQVWHPGDPRLHLRVSPMGDWRPDRVQRLRSSDEGDLGELVLPPRVEVQVSLRGRRESGEKPDITALRGTDWQLDELVRSEPDSGPPADWIQEDDETGELGFDELTPGPHAFYMASSAPGDPRVPLGSLQIEGDEVITLHVPPLGRVRVDVRDPDGRPARRAAAPLFIVPADAPRPGSRLASPAVGIVDLWGAPTVLHLAAGRWVLLDRVDGEWVQLGAVTVVPGREVRLAALGATRARR